jgi:hypothetical protein
MQENMKSASHILSWVLLVCLLGCYGYERVGLEDLGRWQPVMPVTVDGQKYAYDTPSGRHQGTLAATQGSFSSKGYVFYNPDHPEQSKFQPEYMDALQQSLLTRLWWTRLRLVLTGLLLANSLFSILYGRSKPPQ